MISEEIIDYLAANSIGVKGTSLFMGFMPDSPDNVVVVRDESAPLIPESQAYNVDASGIQILVRNQNQVTARNTTFSIHNLIAGFTNDTFVTGGKGIVHTDITTTPSYIGPDDRNRHTWTVHYAFRIGNITQNRTITL
jgi:hypothetical protein